MGSANNFKNFSKVVSSSIFLRISENTLVISSMTTTFAVVLGYLVATLLWRTSGWQRSLVFGFVLLPFWTSLLIKNFAWAFLLQDNGLINNGLMAMGLITEPLPMLHHRFAVIVGMVHYVLPYAVFPIYTALLAIDDRLHRAARSLGAPSMSVLFRITLPLARPGIYAAALLVFIISASFYVTPVILGSPREMMIANLVQFYTSSLVDFGAAATLSILILVAACILISIYQSMPKEGQHG
jgi:ABC-type spermidine/putrescine transport system permease subunit I